MKKLILLNLFIVGAINVYSGTFTSNGGSTSWNAGATAWTIVGDADGIPDSDDDVVIQNGHTIIWGAASASACRNLTVDLGGTLSSTGGISRSLNIHGNFTVNGTETANGTVLFVGAGTTIDGTGTHSANSQWVFSTSRTISTITVTKNYWVRLQGASTVVTNNGNLTLYSINCSTAGATWRQGTNSTLRIRTQYLNNSPVAGIFDASTNPNLVILDWTPLKTIPSILNNQFYNLQLPSNRFAQTSVDIEVLNNLTIGNNSILNLNHNLSIGGNFIGIVNSHFNQAAGTTVTMNGLGAQSISTPGYTFQNLEIDNSGTGVSFTLPNSYSILESLAITNGTLIIPATTTVTLVSTAAQTAIIGPSSGTVNGNLTLQRFISGREAGYSDMAAPTNDATFAQIDDDMLTSFVYNPPYAYPSIWMYNESIWDYVPITDVNTTMFQGVGYEVFLDSYGDTITWDPTTIEFVGNPTIGDLDIAGNISFDNDGWNLVGNPYHANLDWDALFNTTTDVSTDIMFYDESINDFITVTTGSGELIAPAQGFWINITSGAPTFTFTEAIKSTSKSSNYRSHGEELFSVRLKNIGSTKFTSGTSFRFTNDLSTAAKGDLPFKKLAHPLAPGLYSLNNKKGLKIKLVNGTAERIEIPLGMTCGVEGIYTIAPEYLNQALSEGYNCIQLIDKEKNTVTSLMEQPYQFYSEKGEFNSRFILVLSKSDNCDKPAVSAVNASVDINRIDNHAVIGFKFDEEKQVKISITNAIGQEIVPSQTAIFSYEQKYIGLPEDFHGIFLVNVWVDGQIISKKLFK